LAFGKSDDQGLKEKVVAINRVSKVVKGGRRFKLTALVVVGDENGRVGIGYGKANEVPTAIQKGIEDAKKNLFDVPRVGSTIPHAIIGRSDAAKVMLKPAAPGTGIIACGPVRAVLELAGIGDIFAKSLGTTNTINLLKGAVQGLQSLRTAAQVAETRGKTVKELLAP